MKSKGTGEHPSCHPNQSVVVINRVTNEHSLTVCLLSAYYVLGPKPSARLPLPLNCKFLMGYNYVFYFFCARQNLVH